MAHEPLSPAVISKLPQGLLGFFGIKNGGQYPQTIGNVIVPTLGMWDMITSNYFENVWGYFGANTVGFHQINDAVTGVPIQVPNSELWYVHALSLHVIAGVGETANYSCAIRSTQTGTANPWYRAITDRVAIAASTTQLTRGEEFPIWASAGDQFGIFIDTPVGGTIDYGVHFRISRLPF